MQTSRPQRNTSNRLILVRSPNSETPSSGTLKRRQRGYEVVQVPMEENSVSRITEQSNPLTWSIDTAVPQDVVHQISQCELEIFQGWREYENIYSERILQGLQDVIEKAVQIFKNPGKSCIVMSGSGTSGRLAFYVSRDVNGYLEQELGLPPLCDYLISGDDIALLRSTESQEDDAILGSRVLEKLCEDKDVVLYIGITCGLSAAYVAGQVDYCLQHLDKVFPVLIGFNPLNQASGYTVENWDKTCASVFNRLRDAQREKKAAILNPVIGPEPITGSSRMKGGTATKVLLDVIFQASLHRAATTSDSGTDSVDKEGLIVKSLLDQYHEVFRSSSGEFRKEVGAVISIAGESLRNDGHVYYIGEGLPGMLGLVDASECPPTFGSDFEDVRGFLQGGFTSWGNTQGNLGNELDISLLSFERRYLSKLSKHDTVVLIGPVGRENELSHLWEKVKKTPARTVCIQDEGTHHKSTVTDEGVTIQVHLRVPWSRLQPQLEAFSPPLRNQIRRNLVQISLKRTLNMISTGAHILRGKVYNNYMIDLKLSNNKLFYRGINIIVKLLGVSEEAATEAILRAIYRCDSLTEGTTNCQVSRHVQKASTTPKVLPLTILLLSKEGSTIEGALQTLEKYPAIRTAFQDLSKQ